MMFHDEMADYFQFLGLQGFKRLHEYHFLSETKLMRKLKRHFIDYENELPDVREIDYDSKIPQAWIGRKQSDVDFSTRQRAVRQAMDIWVEWEQETLDVYSKAYSESKPECKEWIGCLTYDVAKELKQAKRLRLKLESCDYSMDVIIEMQDKFHDKFRKKYRG